MSSAANTVLGALVALLEADPNVAALVADRIYDEVPRDARGDASTDLQSPWIYLGPLQQARLEFGPAEAWTIRARLYAASTAYGRREVWTVVEAIKATLDLKPLAVDGWTIRSMRVVTLGDIPPPAHPVQAFVDLDMVAISQTPYAY